MWYPGEDEREALQEQLEDAAQSWNSQCVTSDFPLRISEGIADLARLVHSDPYLIRDWVWVAARLRIAHPHDQPTARSAWGGLIVFLGFMNQIRAGKQELLPSLRWISDRVVEDLIESVGPQAINQFVSPKEQERIDDLLLKLTETTEPDRQTLVDEAERVAHAIDCIHHTSYFPASSAKLRSLALFVHEESEAGRWARAALRYVQLEQDVIEDNQGYLGYLDDIQVIDDAYEFVHGNLAWKRLLNQACSRWPMLSRIHWQDGGITNHLQPFLKTAAACVLESVFDTERLRVIVIPETGPVGFVSAALCALVDLRAEAEPKLPAPGTIVTFREGHLSRYGLMHEPYDAGNGVMLPMLELRDGVRRAVPAQFAALLEHASDHNPRLATSHQMDRWMQLVEAEKLTPVWRYRRKGVRPSVLYVTDRSNFFDAMEHIRPFGRKLEQLIPVAYHTRGAQTTIGAGAATVIPALVVCNDLATAEVTLRSAASQEHLPRYIIIDRRVDPDSLHSFAYHCRRFDADIRVVIFTPPDGGPTITQSDHETNIWMLRYEEVNPFPDQPVTFSPRSTGGGMLASFNRRQAAAPKVEFRTIRVPLEELDQFAELADNLCRRARHDQDSELEGVAIAAEIALRKISGQSPAEPALLNGDVGRILDRVSELASINGLYDEQIAAIAEKAARLKSALGSGNPKSRNLFSLGERYPDACVVVPSRAQADELNANYAGNTDSKLLFVASHDLERLTGRTVVIVPSWLGTQNMRRLQLGGWAPLQIRMLFSYEIARVERLNSRLSREFKRLARKTRRSWRRLSEQDPSVGKPPRAQEMLDERAPDIDQEGEPIPDAQNNKNDGAYTDWVEAAIRRRIAGSERTPATNGLIARLVFFDDGLHYGVFAREASVICLNEIIGGASSAQQISEQEAEKLLWKKVNTLSPGDILAFPDDIAYNDVIDNLAEALIGDNGQTRQLAGLWRRAIHHIAYRCGWHMERVQRQLAEVGVEREVSTLNSWLYSSRTVAPQNPATTVPAILSCAAMHDLGSRQEEILAAVDSVYSARRKAGHLLVAQLSSASISASSETVVVPVNDTYVRYRVLTVETVDGAARFDSSELGLHVAWQETHEASA